MATQLMIYESAVPVSSQRHRAWSVRAGKEFGFARGLNSIPLTAAEFGASVGEYPIVFAGPDDAVMPTAILGTRDGENLFLDHGGMWSAKYVPAFIRRYPFVFARPDAGENFTLCIDEQFSGCNQDGRGERMFDADGEQTQYLATVLEFLKRYQIQFELTRPFCARLRELELLEPMRAQFRFDSGEESSLGGFMAVNRERLKALDDNKLGEMMRGDEIELIYLHLQSLRNFGSMAKRIRGALPPDATAGDTAPALTTRGPGSARTH